VVEVHYFVRESPFRYGVKRGVKGKRQRVGAVRRLIHSDIQCRSMCQSAGKVASNGVD